MNTTKEDIKPTKINTIKSSHCHLPVTHIEELIRASFNDIFTREHLKIFYVKNNQIITLNIIQLALQHIHH